MGKITREELANSLNDHIESQSKNKQNKTDDSLKTSDKTIVGAINELYQDINDGKQIIADAINNNSITKDSAFEAMGEAIRGLNTKINNLTNESASKVTPAGTAIANDVLSGKTFINNTGHIITGTMANQPKNTYFNGYKAWTNSALYIGIPNGAYINNTSAANGPEIYMNYTDIDPNWIPANIVSGKSICGVTGTATASSLGGRRFTSGTVSATGGARTVTFSVGFTPSLLVAVHVDASGFPLYSVYSTLFTSFTCRMNGTCENKGYTSVVNGTNITLALQWSSYYINESYTISWWAID